MWRQDASRAAAKRAVLTRAAVDWAIRAVGVEFMSVSRVAAGLGVSWHTANDAILERAKTVLIDDPGRLKGVEVIGVDEHAWRHTRKGDKYVTVIIDAGPGTRPYRPLQAAGHGPGLFQAGLQAMAPGTR